MSVHLKCDRCGNQERTSGVMLFAGLTDPAIPTARPELPDGWTRPRLPHEDGSAWDRELCPECKADLIRFMAGAVLAPDVAEACTEGALTSSEDASNAEALRLSEKNGACTNCGAAPDRWCETCASCPAGCYGGHKSTEPCPEEVKTSD